jgi:hypothetical protein
MMPLLFPVKLLWSAAICLAGTASFIACGGSLACAVAAAPALAGQARALCSGLHTLQQLLALSITGFVAGGTPGLCDAAAMEYGITFVGTLASLLAVRLGASRARQAGARGAARPPGCRRRARSLPARSPTPTRPPFLTPPTPPPAPSFPDRPQIYVSYILELALKRHYLQDPPAGASDDPAAPRGARAAPPGPQFGALFHVAACAVLVLGSFCAADLAYASGLRYACPRGA